MISPRASEITLPCSEVMISASSPFLASSSSRNLKKIDCLLASDKSRQAGKAALAALMVAAISEASAKPTLLVASPSAGSKTSPNLPDLL